MTPPFVRDSALREEAFRFAVALLHDVVEDTAVIYAADKVAKLREAGAGRLHLRPAQLTHHRAVLGELGSAYPQLPLLDELRRALDSVSTP